MKTSILTSDKEKKFNSIFITLSKQLNNFETFEIN
jgi:hypothetical protein